MGVPPEDGGGVATAYVDAGGGGLRLMGEVGWLALEVGRQVNEPQHFDGVAECIVLGCGLSSSVRRAGGGVHVTDDDGWSEHGHLAVSLGQGLEEGFHRAADGDVVVDDVELPSVHNGLVDAQSPWDAEVVDGVDVDAGPGIQGAPLVPVAFVHSLVRGIYGGGFWRVVALKALLLEGEKVEDPVRPLCHRELMEGGGGVLGVCDGRVVEVEEVDVSLDGRGPGLWGPSSRRLPRQGAGLGPGDFLLGDGRLDGRGGGGAWLHSGGSPPVYLVPLWALFSGLTCRMGWVLLSSKVWPSGLSVGAAALVELLLAVSLHPDLHPTVWARVLEAVLDRAPTPDPVARVVVAERLLDSRALLELWVGFGLRRCLWREGG